MYFQMILVNRDLVYHEFQIIALHLGLVQQIIEYVERCLCRAVDLDDRVALVGQQFDLVIQAVDFILQLGFHLVVQRPQCFLVLRVLHNIADALTLGGLEFCRQIIQHLGQIVRRLFGFHDLIILTGQFRVQPVEHLRRAVHHPTDVQPHKLVQLVYADMVARAARSSAAVIGAAGVRRGNVRTAHRKHRCAAVAALEETRIDVIVFLDTAVVRAGALLPQSAGGRKRAVVDDRLMVVLDNDLFVLVAPDIPAVDLYPGELALPQCADIEIVVKDSLHSHKRPRSLNFPPGRPALGMPAHLLRHARRRHALLGQVVGNLLVAPAIIVVEIKNPAHNIRFGRHDLKLLLSVDDVAIRCGAQPFAVRLPPFDNIADLA